MTHGGLRSAEAAGGPRQPTRSVVDLTAGDVEYEDTGGDGPVLVFVHGLLMDGSVWRAVVAGLRSRYRCIVPTLPLGAHRRPMRRDADLSLRAMGLMIGEFLDALQLTGVTVVQNDWGGVQVLIAHGGSDRIERVVLTSCEAFENYPPKIAWALPVLAKVPGGLLALMQALRYQVVRRAPGGWGWMSKRPVPRPVMDDWFRPARVSAAVRRDLRKYLGSEPNRQELLAWANRSRLFTRPVLVIWAAEDRTMPLEHGRRLAGLFPDARLIEVLDSYTLLSEDRPDAMIAGIEEFVPVAAQSPPVPTDDLTDRG